MLSEKVVQKKLQCTNKKKVHFAKNEKTQIPH